MEEEVRTQLVIKLTAINEILERYEGSLYSDYYRQWFSTALSGNGDELEKFLVSNELWGGSGSLCDSALLKAPIQARKEFEELMIEVAEIQIPAGLTNPRTQFWTQAFKQWSA